MGAAAATRSSGDGLGPSHFRVRPRPPARGLGGRYFDLEQEPERLHLDLQWQGLESGRALVVLDEAQAWPEVVPRLRSAIDRLIDARKRILISRTPRSVASDREVSFSLPGFLRHALNAPGPRGLDRA